MRIYSGKFIELVLMLPGGSVGQASNREDLRKHGTVEYRGKPVDVFAAEDISLWILDRVGQSIGTMLLLHAGLDLSPAAIETILGSARPGAVERHLSTGPITWLSDYEHHGGRSEVIDHERSSA